MKRSSVLLLLAGAVLIAAGVLQEEHVMVLHKGVNLCLECVGIG